MSSWNEQLCKKEVKELLTIELEIDVEKMTKKDLIDELEYYEMELSKDEKECREILVKKLYEELGAKARLRRTVVGALISTLFFKYRNELVTLLIDKKPFKLGILGQDKYDREKHTKKLNNVYSKKLVQEMVLKSIDLLNSSSHLKNNWFFREVLENVVNENLDKLRAVCVTLCKGAVEDLLKDVKPNESFSLNSSRINKSYTDNNTELLYDLSWPLKTKILNLFCEQPLRQRMEKSIIKKTENKTASSSNIPSIQISTSNSPDSKPKKNFKQNNDQIRKSQNANSSHFYLNDPNNSLKFQTMGTNHSHEKLLPSTTPNLNELITSDLPEIDRLMEVHDKKYKQRVLDKIFDFGNIASHPYLQCSSRILENLSPMDRSRYEFSHLRDEDIAVIESYEKGVSLLKLGLEKRGKKEIMKAADMGLPHASCVCAMITFKEVVQFNNDKSRFSMKKINETVQYMQCIKQEFFPLPSFILGIMLSYNQIYVDDPETSARQCFTDVLRGIRYSESNHSLVVPRKYIVIDESDEYFKWIVQSSKYELARDLLLHSEDLSTAKSLLQELSLGDFVDAKCFYALTLLKNVFRDVEIFKKINFIHAYGLLEQAVDNGHKEAMFFFGTLPFRQEFKLLDEESRNRKGKECFDYLGQYLVTCGEYGDFRKDAAILIAAEYVKNRSSYVTYDEEKAKIILKEYNCLCKLQEFEEKLQKLRENVLPSVLNALKKVYSELKKNEVQPAQPLSSAVKELLDALQSSALIVHSPLLQPILKLLHLSSTTGLRFLLSPLQQLCEVLKSQVESQSNCSKLLSPLQNLLSTCFELQIERSCNTSRIPSEGMHGSTLLYPATSTKRCGSFSGFGCDYNFMLIPPSDQLARNRSESK
ncbi:hypothetical protein TNCT_148722 [Trichonephila clavata]|nr:hypothetical protein TNCT_148722 [Trichonephila clavata]